MRVGGLVASTWQLQGSIYNYNNFTLVSAVPNSAMKDSSIKNEGNITATAGSVVLLAPDIVNTGRINASGGDIVMSNAQNVRINLGEMRYLGVESFIDENQAGVIKSSGFLQASILNATGGRVILQAGSSELGSGVMLSRYIRSDAGLKISGSKVDVGALTVENDVEFIGTGVIVRDVFNIEGQHSTLSFSAMSDKQVLNTGKINLNAEFPAFEAYGRVFQVIRSLQDLKGLSESSLYNPGYYVLANDIDASSTRLWNNGAGFKPIGDSSPFQGGFEGLGHAIKGLYINRPSENVAMFKMASNSNINNLDLRNASISGSSAAGLVYFSTGSNLVNNRVSGHIRAKIRSEEVAKSPTKSLAAGLVGVGIFNNINNNTVSATISSLGLGNANWLFPGNTQEWIGVAGGLMGINTGGIVSRNTVSGNISGQYQVGGLVGYNSNYSEVANNFADVNVLGKHPANAASSYGFFDLLIGLNKGEALNNTNTGSITIR